MQVLRHFPATRYDIRLYPVIRNIDTGMFKSTPLRGDAIKSVISILLVITNDSVSDWL